MAQRSGGDAVIWTIFTTIIAIIAAILIVPYTMALLGYFIEEKETLPWIALFIVAILIFGMMY